MKEEEKKQRKKAKQQIGRTVTNGVGPWTWNRHKDINSIYLLHWKLYLWTDTVILLVIFLGDFQPCHPHQLSLQNNWNRFVDSLLLSSQKFISCLMQLNRVAHARGRMKCNAIDSKQKNPSKIGRWSCNSLTITRTARCFVFIFPTLRFDFSNFYLS